VAEPLVHPDDELRTPYQRSHRPEPQTNQQLSPQLDFLQRVEYQFAQWIVFADAKAGGVILILSIGALDVFHKAHDYIDAHNLRHPAWGWTALLAFAGSVVAMAITVAGVGRTLFPKIRESRPSDNFFGVVARYQNEQVFATKIRNMRETDLLESLATQCWNLARINDDKYRNLRRAYIGAFFFLVSWGVARFALSLASG
jgi:hypothetical protein